MYTLTVVLDADDTPKSIVTLSLLATTRSSAGVGIVAATDLLGKKLRSGVGFFMIRGESGNDSGATGAARLAFDAHADRTIATQHGAQLLPGLRYDYPSIGAGQVYDFANTFLSGKTGDEFQIEFGKL